MGMKLKAIFADQSYAERFDRVVELLLGALLAFSPLALGVVHAWSEQVVVVLAAAISLTFLLKWVMVRETRFVWSWAYVPVAVFLLIGLLQLVPLPRAIVTGISPNTTALKAELLGDLPGSEESLSATTLSFYPHATRHDMRMILAVAAVFVVVLNVYRQPQRIMRLLAVIAVMGSAVALLALAQDVAGNGRIYWSIPTYDRAYSGPFVNHSHYGQFMNLSIGAALGLLFVKLHVAFGGHRVTPTRVVEYLRSPASRVPRILVAVVVLGAATVFVSLTRGGMISMLIAGVFTTLMLSWRQSLRGRGWIMVLVALGTFVCVLWVGFDQVYDRLATLRDFHRAEGGRWQIVRDIALAWTKFPLFGVGLGTHEVVYPMFDRSTIAALAMHAENEYAQAAEETGLAGLLALVGFGVLVWMRYAASIRNASIPLRSAAYGLGFGLLAILIHSLSDFGQHLPANALLSAVCCALLIVLADTGHKAESAAAPLSSSAAARAGRAGMLLFAAGAWVWVVLGANSARVAQAHWHKVLAAEHHLEAAGWLAPPEAYEYLFAHATAAARAEPDNIHYRHWLGAYQWLSLTPYLDPNTQQLDPNALPWARQIVEGLHAARPLCPTFGATCCLAGEIEMFVLGDPNGVARIRQGYRLAPCDATACFAAARVEAEQGRAEQASVLLARAVQLDGRYFQRAVHLCVDKLQRSDLAVRLADSDAGRLAWVGNLLAGAAKGRRLTDPNEVPADLREQQRLAAYAEERAFEELKVRCEEASAPASAHASLANHYRRRGEIDLAIRHCRRAVRLDYDQVSWHYLLAHLLAETGHLDEAIHEARICLRLREDYAPAKRLADELEMRLVRTK